MNIDEDDLKKGVEADDNDADDFEVVDAPPEKPVKDERAKQSDDEDEDEDDEEGSPKEEGEAEDGAEREALRERRRQEKRERRAAQKAARERDQAKLRQMEMALEAATRQLADLQSARLQQEARDTDARLAHEAQRYTQAEAAIRDASARGDGDLMTRALRQRDDAAAKHRQLSEVRQRLTKAPAPAQEQAPSLDPRIAQHAKSFMDENDWYSPQGRDDDSAIMTALDNKIAEEGFRPETEEYWQELRKRAARALPHRFKSSAPAARKGPPTTTSREHVPVSTRRQVHISPERKAAMIEAGVWDDPAQRNRMLKYYEQYDKQNKS